MELDPTSMCELLVGLPVVGVLGVLDAEHPNNVVPLLCVRRSHAPRRASVGTLR